MTDPEATCVVESPASDLTLIAAISSVVKVPSSAVVIVPSDAEPRVSAAAAASCTLRKIWE